MHKKVYGHDFQASVNEGAGAHKATIQEQEHQALQCTHVAPGMHGHAIGHKCSSLALYRTPPILLVLQEGSAIQ